LEIGDKTKVFRKSHKENMAPWARSARQAGKNRTKSNRDKKKTQRRVSNLPRPSEACERGKGGQRPISKNFKCQHKFKAQGEPGLICRDNVNRRAVQTTASGPLKKLEDKRANSGIWRYIESRSKREAALQRVVFISPSPRRRAGNCGRGKRGREMFRSRGDGHVALGAFINPPIKTRHLGGGRKSRYFTSRLRKEGSPTNSKGIDKVSDPGYPRAREGNSQALQKREEPAESRQTDLEGVGGPGGAAGNIVGTVGGQGRWEDGSRETGPRGEKKEKKGKRNTKKKLSQSLHPQM